MLSSGQTIVTDEQYTQTGSNTSDNRFTSELMIHNVQLTDSGEIRCSLQNNDYRYAFLLVQSKYVFVNCSLSILNGIFFYFFLFSSVKTVKILWHL